MKYAVRKVLTMGVTILVVSFLVFLAFSIIPGDPALAKLGTQATPERCGLSTGLWHLYRVIWEHPIVIRCP